MAEHRRHDRMRENEEPEWRRRLEARRGRRRGRAHDPDEEPPLDEGDDPAMDRRPPMYHDPAMYGGYPDSGPGSARGGGLPRFGWNEGRAAGRSDAGIWGEGMRGGAWPWRGGDAAVDRGRDPRGEETGPYRGRGPRGYVRSDARIREDVSDLLCDDPLLDASGMEVEVSNGEVTLSGSVEDRRSKRRAEDIVDSVSGVRHCQNNLRIRPPEGRSGDMPAR